MNKIESIKKENLNETINVSSAELFGIKTDFEVPQFLKKADHCPPIDKNYVFDEDTTVAILLGLKFNKRVFLELKKLLMITKFMLVLGPALVRKVMKWIKIFIKCFWLNLEKIKFTFQSKIKQKSSLI